MKKTVIHPPIGERRYDALCQWRCMASAENYVMARRYRGGVKVIHVEAWMRLSTDSTLAVLDPYVKARQKGGGA